MYNKETYRRIKINWWLILILVGMYVGICIYILFRSIDKTGFVVVATFLVTVIIVCLCVGGRFIVSIDDNFVIIKTDLCTFLKIPITKIRNVNIERLARAFLGGVYYGKNLERFHFDFVKQAVSIQMKSGKNYQIAIKNAERIKEEIEKRMSK